jgi:hypothetical protein
MSTSWYRAVHAMALLISHYCEEFFQHDKKPIAGLEKGQPMQQSDTRTGLQSIWSKI